MTPHYTLGRLVATAEAHLRLREAQTLRNDFRALLRPLVGAERQTALADYWLGLRCSLQHHRTQTQSQTLAQTPAGTRNHTQTPKIDKCQQKTLTASSN